MLRKTDDSRPNPLASERFPRSSRYDHEWILANEMGPNALWLLEGLCERLELEPGMRVLDMGCGRAMTSIYLAREHGVRVWANDLWVAADDNWLRVREAGLEDLICPLRAEAHALPYAAEFFDAIISVDSYQYYGTDDLYLGYITRLLKPGGKLGLSLAGLTREIGDEGPPEHLTRKQESGAVFWDPAECWCFHSPEWWGRHLGRTSLVEVEHVGAVDEGCKLWLDWEKFRNGGGLTGFPSEAEALEADGGDLIAFVEVVARRTAPSDPGAFHSLTFRL